ncbi:3-deoxy-manno-octulosonate cytidylyltransferase [Candidatus Thioglobus sp.]|nr:3-deoxy-manno-octulosonate cytidylyltransferase [Candidatus Thioglobus sp.]
MKTIGVIPCRYQSSRFPGKSLALINEKPMMWHVYQRVLESKVCDEIYVATDDQRIKNACNDLGIASIMTRTDHQTGTDRLAEAANEVEGDYYINIQGDEPSIDPEAIKAVALGIINCQDESVVASNGYALIENTADVLNTNIVKVIMNVKSNALAYSRQPIPYPQSGISKYYRQLGLYGFTKKGLEVFSRTIAGPIENSEQVEMYRFIENELKVVMIETNDDSISVDTQHDLSRVINLMQKK